MFRYSEKCLDIILKAFRDIGYTVDWRILNACKYLVLQSRKRIIIIGTNNSRIQTFPFPVCYGDDEGK
ncbi:MAG: DNA cytosine methyltransferase [bacterium]